jgi:hypothetical protein
MVRWWIAIAIAAAAVGCGAKQNNQCPATSPGTTPRVCLSGEVCSFNRSSGCQVCQCRPWGQPPTANDPDDPKPAIPVH